MLEGHNAFDIAAGVDHAFETYDYDYVCMDAEPYDGYDIAERTLTGILTASMIGKGSRRREKEIGHVIVGLRLPIWSGAGPPLRQTNSYLYMHK